MTVKCSVPDYLFTFIFKLIVIEKKHLLVRLNICSSFNGNTSGILQGQDLQQITSNLT